MVETKRNETVARSSCESTLLPARYQILRGVENRFTTRLPVAERPLEVWTLLDELAFLRIGLRHHVSAFMEDCGHDWSWCDGYFSFHGHSRAPGALHDLVLVYDV